MENFKEYSQNLEQKTTIQLTAYRKIYDKINSNRIRNTFLIVLGSLILVLFLPWTQNFAAEGKVTTRRQENRPQKINTIISGKIVKWYVKEGDIVQKGDTIVKLGEVKDNYLDPALLAQTQYIIDQEYNAVNSYSGKNQSIDSQMDALEAEQKAKLAVLENKLMQNKRKIESDSIKVTASQNEADIAQRQYEGALLMFEKGVIPLTEKERRKVNLQNSLSKVVNANNDWNNTKQEASILRLEINGITQSYNEKIAKAQGDFYQSSSQIAQGKGKISKLENEYSNYKIRSNQYYILAPQSGQISKIANAGINEIIKEMESIAEIVPNLDEVSAEIFVSPMDVQLIQPDQDIMLTFDGFPAIVFAGWPNQSYGTFKGKIIFVENNINANGKFRVLIAENKDYKPWPKALRLGSGVKSLAMLKDVKIWYELWRRINGFPPDFYVNETTAKSKNK
jgi:multidrug efflux pump subunit AcrA (membrane-fusion protein)